MFTESAELYDAIYSFKDYAAEAAQISALVRSHRPTARTILDVACGTGEHARHLVAAHGFEVDGLDLDPGLLRLAREKLPHATFFEADMSEFLLEKRYDVILCLFSSIAYLVTLERTRRALECFRRHLSPAGMVLVEPWFPPGRLENKRVMRQAATYRGGRVERISRCEIDGRISRLWFKYRVETAEGIRQVSEVHELGLFTNSEMASTFREAGFETTFDESGLSDRGLWTARSTSDLLAGECT